MAWEPALQAPEPLRQPDEQTMGRKVRILALHGAPANSNIMRFQTATLRRLLGADAEWVVPDALYQMTTVDDGMREGLRKRFTFFPITAFEERLSQGKPFVSWFKLVEPEGVEAEAADESYIEVISDPVTLEGSLSSLEELVEKEAPLDVVVAFSQGALIATFLANRLRKVGKPIPWRLALLFSSTGACPTDYFEPPLPTPTFFVTSPLFLEHDVGVSCFSQLYSDITILEHNDGMAFPTTQPRAQEIYERLASEMRQLCAVEARRGRTWAAWCRGEVGLNPRASEASGASGGAEELRPAVVAILTPAAVADLLQKRICLVADVRSRSEARCSPFPGAEGDVSFFRLQWARQDAIRELTELREDGRRVVAISADGDRCAEYCSLLVDKFGFREDRLCRLGGGVSAWEAWELKHQAQANDVRRFYGLPLRKRGLEVAALAPPELAELLLAGRCVVADARQPQEMRGRPFPGTKRDLSFYVAQKRPEQVRGGLQQLLDESHQEPPQIAAVSICGNRCQEYCKLLIERFEVPANRVLRLDGGLGAWDAWERENPEAARQLRTACSLFT